MVTLWAPGLPPAGTVDQAWSTRTDAQGRFRFGSLRPGEYRVAAWEKIEPGLADTPEFRVRFEDAAAPVKVGEDARETVQAPLIGRERIESEAARLP